MRVDVLRGGRLESAHEVAWVVWRDGAVADAGGPARTEVFLRSCAKPLQALVAVRAGVLERFGLEDRHLAVASASHGGGDEHVAVVGEVLAACGLDEDALRLGEGAPRDPGVAGAPSRLRHNCSGKHALALAACLAHGWDAAAYLDVEHPLQRAVLAEVAAACGVDPGAISEATDGCGMRTYQVPFAAAAAAFGRLASGGLGADGARVAAAMGAHPHLVAYRGAIDTELMAAVPGLVAKIGAEGLLALGLPDGRGAALKVVDGAMRAIDPAAVLLAREVLGLDVSTAPLDALAHPALRNSRDEVVGELRASLR